MGRVIYRLTVTDADIGDTVTCTGAFTPPAGGTYNGDEFTFNTATTAGGTIQCEPRHSTNGLRGFRPGPTQTGYSTAQLTRTVVFGLICKNQGVS